MRFVSDPTPEQKKILDGIELLRGADILEQLAGGPASDSWLLTAGASSNNEIPSSIE